jgi:16S rRNA (cytidine1402-2'-O)-methyltransferase
VLVEAVRKELPDADIIPIPGPSALAAAVSVSGWPLDKFIFLGFLPHKKGRQTMVRQVVESEYPVVLYESKYRVRKLMEELGSASDNVWVFLAREISKMFESFYEGSPEEIITRLDGDPNSLKGEFVVIIRKKEKKKR